MLSWLGLLCFFLPLVLSIREGRAASPTCNGAGPVPSGLTVQTEFGNKPKANVRKSGIFAVHWYGSVGSDVLDTIIGHLHDVRCLSLKLGMKDPPNPRNGHYVNIYLHRGDQDAFPGFFGNGVGTDKFGLPYLAVSPYTDKQNTYHEGFHLMQYSAKNFEYAGDKGWYIEATADWFAAINMKYGEYVFITANSISAVPHLAMWHGYGNGGKNDPDDWYHLVHQYAMSQFVFYLTEVKGVARKLILQGFYGKRTQKSPQKWLSDKLPKLGDYFADWAAANTNKFSYLTRKQVEAAKNEAKDYGDPRVTAYIVRKHGRTGTSGQFVRPQKKFKPRGWAYNVIRLSDPGTGKYVFRLKGGSKGSKGAKSLFKARVLITRKDGSARVLKVGMGTATTGSIQFATFANDARVDFVVASVPKYFNGVQKYGYQYAIQRL